MKALKPTVTPAVPRLLNRIFDKVQSDISNSFIKRTLYNMAMSSKENEIRRLVTLSDILYVLINFVLITGES